jgi:adenosylcobinamide kinase/adenosylcobinamide-phosphate guanylyltransferase
MTGGQVALVLGGAASGKSAHAEAMAVQASPRAVYIATAEALDDEMRRKIEAHRTRRGGGWETVEAPLDLAEAIARHDGPGASILVDCLTLWLSNLLGAGRDAAAETDALVAVLDGIEGRIVLVSNEIGLGLVPENALARSFRNLQGMLNQRVAAASDTVVFVAAGLPLALKGGGR